MEKQLLGMSPERRRGGGTGPGIGEIRAGWRRVCCAKSRCTGGQDGQHGAGPEGRQPAEKHALEAGGFLKGGTQPGLGARAKADRQSVGETRERCFARRTQVRRKSFVGKWRFGFHGVMTVRSAGRGCRGGEDAAQRRSRAMGAHPDVSTAPTGESGNLPDRVFLQVQKCEDEPGSGFELRQSSVNPFCGGIGGIISAGRLLRQVRRVRQLLMGDLMILAAASAAQPVIAGTYRERPEPGGKGNRVPQGRQTFPQPQADFLGEIVEVVVVAGEAPCDLENAGLQSGNQRRKGTRLIAARRGGQMCKIFHVPEWR